MDYRVAGLQFRSSSLLCRRCRLVHENGPSTLALNHWFDALYNACVAGHAAGVRLIRENKVIVPPIVRYGVLSKGFTNQRF